MCHTSKLTDTLSKHEHSSKDPAEIYMHMLLERYTHGDPSKYISKQGYSWTSWHRHTETSNKISDSTQTPPSVPTMWPCGKHIDSSPGRPSDSLTLSFMGSHVLHGKICLTQQTSVPLCLSKLFSYLNIFL